MSPAKISDSSAAEEVTPLLAGSQPPPITQNDGSLLPENATRTSNEEDKPLPKSQIFFLCYARLVEPIAFFSIFPFVNKMIFETGNLKEADVGFYSGLIVRRTFLPPKLMIHTT
jgi:hypothetical protein